MAVAFFATPDKAISVVRLPPPLSPPLLFRRIDLARDRQLAVAHHIETSIASFGSERRFKGEAAYLNCLRSRIEEYPDGHVLAFCGGECVGQLELQVPYGLAVGYVNLFYITAPFRGRGFGRALHDYAEAYFRSWEASRIELHVSPNNERAVGFYRRMGYRLSHIEQRRPPMWLMTRDLPMTNPATNGPEAAARDADRLDGPAERRC